ncbi:putative gamma-glutamyltransferase-like protein [Hapsidospora chrysogenum ATCC 11550]|uniref:Putative gamma-glutamyltransferase-like protein n=1 Tax=Hapsidospora chrysogenum (strain ATCC 11550 / CBS 779.69 / DSM 880 / IAM 14645 / JCM 23072 / IMI 49137) TaxID=857340 RepID=A0A086SY36_HAPC1|nr:putative gamma-glutamyltransferase-like protein [Hapsidospora chrysogenum ATCC 11550]
MPLPSASLFPLPSGGFQKFASRRSVVHSTEGIVSCTQPLAAKCGLEVLRAGGNAAANRRQTIAAGLNMTEPCSTGIGGDMFILFWDAEKKQVKAMNGSGRSGAKCTLSTIRKNLGIKDDEPGKVPMTSVHAATVPGAPAGWVDTHERFGSSKVTMADILAPAIKLGEQGFPVSEVTAHHWGESERLLRKASPNFAEMLKKDPSARDGCRAPRAGDIMKNPTLAKTFRTLAEEGKAGFYTGRIAEELVNIVKDLGGHLDLDDLKHHLETGSESVDPISIKFTGHGQSPEAGGHGGVELWEHPPNGQGIVALMALGLIQELEKLGKIPTFKPEDFNTAAYLHAIIEALRLGFTDASWFVTDPNVRKVPVQGMISPEYLAERAKLFDPAKASDPMEHGQPQHYVSPALQSSDTVYFAVSDAQGNAASFINSNYAGFGTGIIPKGCGFTLQNRGANFSLDSKHPNCLEPRKRPYHTIIPGMATNIADGSLHSAFGVMGGFMQPQGHVQVLLGQVVCGLNPQQALDAPRVCIGAGMPDVGNVMDWTVNVEEGMPEETIEGLKELGHKVKLVTDVDRAMFGRGQIIRYTVDPVDGAPLWSAGSDPRADGAAYPM